MPRSLVVKVTHALDDPERAHVGCNVAAVALAAGLEVHLFLAVEGVRLAQPDVASSLEVPHGPPISELLDAVYAGGSVTACSPCALRRSLEQTDLREGTQLAGSARFVELATADGAQALVY